MNSFEEAYQEIKTLVKNFKDNENYYLSASYSEMDARRDFIDKFFVALGWDVYHNTQKNPYEQEVKVEKNVAVGKAQKRADYSFCISPNYRDTKFYVEAKKPSKNLFNPDYYFQAIRYGWNANTPIVILTDFEEFHIIDSRFKPDIKSALDRKIERFHYSEYLDKEKLSRIYYLLSHKSVADNSIEKFSAELPKPKGKTVQRGLFKGGYQRIDESFLEELDEIRITLAKIFKKNNPQLSSEELTEATQRTIDRLVFIRFLEDKLIEGEHYVSGFGEKYSVWKDFINASKYLDNKYNGVVFKRHPIIDSPAFKEADDIYFGRICEDLSHENSPYDFNAIPIHILGSIYERFLGKVIHATNKQVKIEEKPEVKKAGGVYYTPQYIVKYIVDNTVGKLIQNKTPAEISKLKFADIACGSGSFLITIYDTLLQYIGNWYQEHPDKAKKDKCIFKDGQWVLSLKQKQEILLNNIYGVDIDFQAVDVTQLSLFLKLLEDETTATANDMQVLFKEKILPDLSKNIVCGNSLIGTDIYDGCMFPTDEERKINAMNFEDVFPEIMKNGGFDAIVGNPPYVKARDYDKDKDYYRNYLNNSSQYTTLTLMWDLYIPFLEKGLRLLKHKGKLGYIIPDTLEKASYASKMKVYLIENFFVPQIDFFPNSYIFKSQGKVIGVKNIVLFVNKSKGDKTVRITHEKNYEKVIKSESVDFNEEIFTITSSQVNFQHNYTIKLGDICLTSYGLRLNSDKQDKKYKFKKTDLISDLPSKRFWKEFTEGKYINRYLINKTKYLEWDSDRCPVRLVRPTFKELYLPEKLLLGRQTKSIAYDNKGYIVDNTIIVCSLHKNYSKVNNNNINKYYKNILDKDRVQLINISQDYSIKYILGILNSRFTKYYLKILSKGAIDIFPDDWKEIPICKIDFTNPSDKSNHDKIVQLVDQMLEAKKQLQKVTTDKDKTYYERKCETLDRQIDQLVYELYGLTEEEIKIVEGDKSE